jgi:hypothetical protein
MHTLHPQVERILRREYPGSTFALSCTDREISQICHDLRVAQFASNIRVQFDTPSSSVQILPEMFELIMRT